MATIQSSLEHYAWVTTSSVSKPTGQAFRSEAQRNETDQAPDDDGDKHPPPYCKSISQFDSGHGAMLLPRVVPLRWRIYWCLCSLLVTVFPRTVVGILIWLRVEMRPVRQPSPEPVVTGGVL